LNADRISLQLLLLQEIYEAHREKERIVSFSQVATGH